MSKKQERKLAADLDGQAFTQPFDDQKRAVPPFVEETSSEEESASSGEDPREHFSKRSPSSDEYSDDTPGPSRYGGSSPVKHRPAPVVDNGYSDSSDDVGTSRRNTSSATKAEPIYMDDESTGSESDSDQNDAPLERPSKNPAPSMAGRSMMARSTAGRSTMARSMVSYSVMSRRSGKSSRGSTASSKSDSERVDDALMKYGLNPFDVLLTAEQSARQAYAKMLQKKCRKIVENKKALGLATDRTFRADIGIGDTAVMTTNELKEANRKCARELKQLDEEYEALRQDVQKLREQRDRRTTEAECRHD